MNAGISLITIDGPRGTGKSTVARGLRERFGCDVLEIGPLFRVYAWLEARGALSRAPGRSLTELMTSAQITVAPSQSGQLTAMSLSLQGSREAAEAELWDPRLDFILRRISMDPEVLAVVSAAMADILVGSSQAAVVGREGASRFFPSAALQIRLEAGSEERHQRKVSQLRATVGEVPPSIDACEPTDVLLANDEYVIDTTGRTARSVLDSVAALVVVRLGWNALSGGECG
jgi:CMP/dCMP kinase